MIVALCTSINFPLITANNVENKAEEIPRSIPFKYLISLCVIKNTPKTTLNLNKISYQSTFRLKIIGSINDAKKAPVENIAKVMETLD